MCTTRLKFLNPLLDVFWTQCKTLSKVVKIEQVKDEVVHFSQNRVVHLHLSGAPESIIVTVLFDFETIRFSIFVTKKYAFNVSIGYNCCKKFKSSHYAIAA